MCAPLIICGDDMEEILNSGFAELGIPVPDGAIEPGSLRIEGRPAEEPVLPGLAAGGQALLTWREPAGGAAQTIGLRYRYTFAGEVRKGVCTL